MIHHRNYGLWALLIGFGVLTFFLLHTFWQYLVFGLILAILFHRPYKQLSRGMNKNVAAFLIVMCILLLLVIPTMYVLFQAIQQAPGAYATALQGLHSEKAEQVLGVSANEVRAVATSFGERLRVNLIQNAGAYLNQATNIFLGLFLMFVTIFFLLRDGERMYHHLLHTFPVRKENTSQFLEKLRSIIDAVLLGQLVTAVIQGLLAGLLFWILGIPNALLLGFLTVLLSIIPMLGPFLIYIPVAVYLFFMERYVAAIVLLAIGTIVLSQIDNIIRPYIAHRTAAVHPLTVIIGAVAGLQLWGLVGFVIGPLILAGFLALYEFSMTGDETALQKKQQRNVKESLPK
jgi:predicted PurR-regulated permease PerM